MLIDSWYIFRPDRKYFTWNCGNIWTNTLLFIYKENVVRPSFVCCFIVTAKILIWPLIFLFFCSWLLAEEKYLQLWNSDEVLLVLKEFRSNKSAGPASILSKFLKLFRTALCKPISQTENLFSSGSFRNNIKIANVIPIFKKDNFATCNNYWPVSLLSNNQNYLKADTYVPCSVFKQTQYILWKAVWFST